MMHRLLVGTSYRVFGFNLINNDNNYPTQYKDPNL